MKALTITFSRKLYFTHIYFAAINTFTDDTTQQRIITHFSIVLSAFLKYWRVKNCSATWILVILLMRYLKELDMLATHVVNYQRSTAACAFLANTDELNVGQE